MPGVALWDVAERIPSSARCRARLWALNCESWSLILVLTIQSILSRHSFVIHSSGSTDSVKTLLCFSFVDSIVLWKLRLGPANTVSSPTVCSLNPFIPLDLWLEVQQFWCFHKFSFWSNRGPSRQRKLKGIGIFELAMWKNPTVWNKEAPAVESGPFCGMPPRCLRFVLRSCESILTSPTWDRLENACNSKDSNVKWTGHDVIWKLSQVEGACGWGLSLQTLRLQWQAWLDSWPPWIWCLRSCTWTALHSWGLSSVRQLCSTRSNGDEESCSVFFVPFAVGLLFFLTSACRVAA